MKAPTAVRRFLDPGIGAHRLIVPAMGAAAGITLPASMIGIWHVPEPVRAAPIKSMMWSSRTNAARSVPKAAQSWTVSRWASFPSIQR
ncbi:hypothetical protein GCM10022226_61300 [Sphaerisporangium flaviroseum]|uniref:Uncharacterized protein n=1 Tax=Sphaerisporangium flaviroseum TaxID=509199 RepID=A0ABP7J208_9ACTN